MEDLIDDGFVEITKLEGCGVYAMVLDEEIIYIGQSANLRRRFSNKHYAYDAVYFLPCEEFHLLRIEKAMIGKYRPPLNKIHNLDAREGKFVGQVCAGTHWTGRPPTLSLEQAQEALRLRNEGHVLEEIAKRFGVSHMTISRLTSTTAIRRR